MTEDFLYYVWKFQRYDRTALRTETGDSLEILHPGLRHDHAGPDFHDARLRIGGIEWAGTVEIHVRASDWQRHRHDADGAYSYVILHVVWELDQPAYRKDGTPVPALILEPRTDTAWLARYREWTEQADELPCGKQFRLATVLTIRGMLDRLLIERLEHKAEKVTGILAKTQNDWEETTWQLLAGALGAPVNQEPMEWLARLLPAGLLRKLTPRQAEALLFAASGLCPEEFTDIYAEELRVEGAFLLKKYGLSPLPASVWKFMRLRPPAFPTRRIAELAALLAVNNRLFIPGEDLCFSFALPDYWTSHYRFGKAAKKPVPSPGIGLRLTLIINALAPAWTAYARYRGDESLLESAISRLEALPPENNRITRLWETYGLTCANAADSQAALHWYRFYCQQKRCLSCGVGANLLGRAYQ